MIYENTNNVATALRSHARSYEKEITTLIAALQKLKIPVLQFTNYTKEYELIEFFLKKVFKEPKSTYIHITKIQISILL